MVLPRRPFFARTPIPTHQRHSQFAHTDCTDLQPTSRLPQQCPKLFGSQRIGHRRHLGLPSDCLNSECFDDGCSNDGCANNGCSAIRGSSVDWCVRWPDNSCSDRQRPRTDDVSTLEHPCKSQACPTYTAVTGWFSARICNAAEYKQYRSRRLR